MDAEILEIFVEAAWAGGSRADDAAAAQAALTEARRERDRARKQLARDIERAWKANIEVVCACGCGRVVTVSVGGRPRKYATARCRWRVAKRAARTRLSDDCQSSEY